MWLCELWHIYANIELNALNMICPAVPGLCYTYANDVFLLTHPLLPVSRYNGVSMYFNEELVATSFNALGLAYVHRILHSLRMYVSIMELIQCPSVSLCYHHAAQHISDSAPVPCSNTVCDVLHTC